MTKLVGYFGVILSISGCASGNWAIQAADTPSSGNALEVQSACPEATPDPEVLNAAGDLLPGRTYVVPCARVVAGTLPVHAGRITVAPDNRTLVIGISWSRPCVELARVDIVEGPTEVNISVFYGKDPDVRGSASPGLPPGAEVCTMEAQVRFTAVRLREPLGGRTVVDLGRQPGAG
jgi:hypothetical protein